MDQRTCRCGTTFTPTHGRQRYCQPEHRADEHAKIPTSCYRCGKITLKEPSKRYKQFCGTTCRDAHCSQYDADGAPRTPRAKKQAPRADPRSRLRKAYEDGDNAAVLAELQARATPLSNGCWQWQGRLRDGYPALRIGARELMAHRLTLEAHLGASLGSQPAHHMCANPACINPDHLQPVTHRENVAEMLARTYMERRIKELEKALRAVDPSNELLQHISLSN